MGKAVAWGTGGRGVIRAERCRRHFLRREGCEKKVVGADAEKLECLECMYVFFLVCLSKIGTSLDEWIERYGCIYKASWVDRKAWDIYKKYLKPSKSQTRIENITIWSAQSS